jgi:S1-C subfamily serine protease
MFRSANSSRGLSAVITVLVLVAALFIGGLIGFYIGSQEISRLNQEVDTLQSQIAALQGTQDGSDGSINSMDLNNTALVKIYANASPSVVSVQSVTASGTVQGSGFVYDYSDSFVVVTNYHVIQESEMLSVTFSDGRGYGASVLGSDPYADLAVISVDAPNEQFHPLPIGNSSALRVGEQVTAIGSPYGLAGSLTAGVISALRRTITEQDYAGNFAIANIVQTTAPINPGNSGGPLLNSDGEVVGVTTAGIAESQGIGFAVPSNTILREIGALVETGTYVQHSYIGVTGEDMGYFRAEELGVDVTYGWRVVSIVPGGPADGELQEGDIIIAINETTIIDNDELAAFLEAETTPGDLIVITIVRDNTTIQVNVVLGTRPSPPG